MLVAAMARIIPAANELDNLPATSRKQGSWQMRAVWDAMRFLRYVSDAQEC